MAQVPGVRSVSVSLETGLVTVGLAEDEPPGAQVLRQAVQDSGFTVDRVVMP